MNEISAIDGVQPFPGPWHSRLDPAAPVLGRIGALETRLARNEAEIEAAQALRGTVFGRSSGERDADVWDRYCDHLLVIDRDGGDSRIVGTYRLFTSRDSGLCGLPFYTAQEFEIGQLMRRNASLEFMELGRSCVLPQWRNKRTMELMWHGVWAHVLAREADVLTGCASFPGTNPEDFAEALSFLHHFAPPPEGWDVTACAPERLTTGLLPRESVNAKRALHALPPLIKGYLRLGARFAREAVIDRAFGTTDVLVILPVESINRRYVAHYGADAGRFATRDQMAL